MPDQPEPEVLTFEDLSDHNRYQLATQLVRFRLVREAPMLGENRVAAHASPSGLWIVLEHHQLNAPTDERKPVAFAFDYTDMADMLRELRRELLGETPAEEIAALLREAVEILKREN